jgi:hypothetical protein
MKNCILLLSMFLATISFAQDWLGQWEGEGKVKITQDWYSGLFYISKSCNTDEINIIKNDNVITFRGFIECGQKIPFYFYDFGHTELTVGFHHIKYDDKNMVYSTSCRKHKLCKEISIESLTRDSITMTVYVDPRTMIGPSEKIKLTLTRK